MKLKYSIFLLIILSSFSLTNMFSKKTYKYINNTEGKVEKSTWIIESKDKKIIIKENSNLENSTSIYTKDYDLETYSLKSKNNRSNYTMQRDKNILIAKGTSNGKNISTRHNLGGQNWVQEFKFGLKSFLNSKKHSLDFVIVNPDDLSTNKLVATKSYIQNISIDNKNYKVQKVDVSLRGLFSSFWKAEIWYDIKNYDLIKYKANKGPGTAISIITLDSVK